MRVRASAAARQLLLLAAMMDVEGFYACQSPYTLPHTPISAEPSALPVSPDPATVSLSQKLDRILTLMQSQSQETAAIRKEFVSVKEDVALLQEKADSSQSRSPLKKKVPTELSVCIYFVADLGRLPISLPCFRLLLKRFTWSVRKVINLMGLNRKQIIFY